MKKNGGGERTAPRGRRPPSYEGGGGPPKPEGIRFRGSTLEKIRKIKGGMNTGSKELNY